MRNFTDSAMPNHRSWFAIHWSMATEKMHAIHRLELSSYEANCSEQGFD